MKKPKIIRSEFEMWAMGTPVLYASCSVNQGIIDMSLRFWAYVDNGAYKVTLGTTTLYCGESFADAVGAFDAA